MGKAQNDHYARNKQQYLDRNAARKRKCREIYEAAKAKPCMDCGIQYPYYVMDMDHRPGEIKVGHPSKLCTHGIQKLLDEIAKCDVVCANCHRIRTYNRNNDSLA